MTDGYHARDERVERTRGRTPYDRFCTAVRTSTRVTACVCALLAVPTNLYPIELLSKSRCGWRVRGALCLLGFSGFNSNLHTHTRFNSHLVSIASPEDADDAATEGRSRRTAEHQIADGL